MVPVALLFVLCISLLLSSAHAGSYSFYSGTSCNGTAISQSSSFPEYDAGTSSTVPCNAVSVTGYPTIKAASLECVSTVATATLAFYTDIGCSLTTLVGGGMVASDGTVCGQGAITTAFGSTFAVTAQCTPTSKNSAPFTASQSSSFVLLLGSVLAWLVM